MAKSPRKSPTVFYWLSLATSAATIVMLFFNWFSFQVASFGIDNLPTQYYGLLDVQRFLDVVPQYVEMEGGAWATTAGVIGLIVTAAVQVVHIVLSLILIRRTPPCGFAAGGVSIAMGLGFLTVFSLFSQHIAAHQLDELVYIEFLVSAFPFILIMLGVATIVFGLLNRQESRALYAVKHPREFVFPPENPETV